MVGRLDMIVDGYRSRTNFGSLVICLALVFGGICVLWFFGPSDQLPSVIVDPSIVADLLQQMTESIVVMMSYQCV